MKAWRVMSCILAFAIIFPQWGVFADGSPEMSITTVNKHKGIIGVKVKTESDKQLKIGIHAENCDKDYYFTYAKEEGDIDIPLIFGNDAYNISLFEELSNKYYTVLESYDVNLDMSDYDAIYLSSSVIVPWSEAEKTIAKADELTKKQRKDVDKFFAIYEYVTENVVYDNQKTVDSGYRSSPDATLSCGKGICLDLAVLLAAMLRSTGIKCKLVYGRAKDMEGLHSWNEVYLKDKWIVVDPTKDAMLFDAYKSYKYYKLPEDYIGTYYF